jgi:hypothetical protein
MALLLIDVGQLLEPDMQPAPIPAPTLALFCPSRPHEDHLIAPVAAALYSTPRRRAGQAPLQSPLTPAPHRDYAACGTASNDGGTTMSEDRHGTGNIPIGTPVVGFNGRPLGRVHEVHPHYLLVREEGQHTDFEVPVHAIRGFVGGQLQVSVNRESVTEVDDEETAHRLQEERR